jgi:multidrug efflux pump subunit AcrB
MFAQRISNPRLLVLGISLLLVAGLGALNSLPRSEDPDLTNRWASIVTPFPGASAERVEALVSEKIEVKLRELHEIEHIHSNSRPGLSVVTLELLPTVYDTEPVMARARDKINDLVPSLPAGAGEPRFDDKRSGGAFTVLAALRWSGSGGLDMNALGRYAQELAIRLQNLPGTEYVSRFGEPIEEFQVTVDIAEVSALQLTTRDIAAAIGRADAKVAAGQLYHDQFQWQMEVSGALDSRQRIRMIPLKLGGNGEIIRLGDIARVERGIRTPAEEIAIIDGGDGVVVAARIRSDVRVDSWTRSVQGLLQDFEQQLPVQVELRSLFNQSVYTEARLGELAGNVGIGFCVILLVLLVTLGWRAALIVAFSLPLVVCFTLFCMQLFGLAIHQISVAGLIVALGIVVDNAIVITEAIAQDRKRGMGRYEAIREALQHYWLPLLGSTLTTILAFMPIVLMPGPGGEFVGGIALTVIFSLVGSFIISHTIVAGLAGRFIPGKAAGGYRWYRHGIEMPRLRDAFSRSLAWSIAHPLVSIAAVASVSALGIVAGQSMTEQFYPPADRDMFHIEVFNDAQASIKATRELVARIDQEVAAQPGIIETQWFVGNSAPSFYYNLIANKDGMPQYAQAMVTTRDYQAADAAIVALQKQLDDEFGEAQILVRKLDQGPPYNAPVELRIYGANLDTLKQLGDELRSILSGLPNVLHTRVTQDVAKPKIWVDIREEEAQLAGLRLNDVAQQLRDSLSGSISGSVVESTEELPVRLRITDDERGLYRNLASTQLVSRFSSEEATLTNIPLASLGELRLAPARSNIARRNGQRVNTVEAFVAVGVLPETVLNALRQELDIRGFQLPAGYTLEIGGESAKRDESVGNLLAYVGVVLTLLVVAVVLTFNSFRLSGIVFLVAFQSATMGMLSVYLAGYAFGFIIIVGLMGLMGLAINAAIVILAELKANPAACGGDSAAIHDSVMVCTRHIVSTTITTIGGFMPLVFDSGNFWPPFAVAIAGGTALTTLLSFYFVPAAFKLAARRRPVQSSATPAIPEAALTLGT